MLYKLENHRKALIDITLKNPLINYKINTSRGIRVINNKIELLFNLLVNKKNKIFFLPNNNTTKDLSLYNFDIQKNSILKRNNYLQTDFSEKELSKKLLNLSRKYKIAIDEKGCNVLFLTFGMLKWFETSTSDIPNFAPLIIIPVHIDKMNVRNKFSIYYEDETILSNYCLAEKLESSYRIKLPKINNDVESFDINLYLNEVKKRICFQNRWEVINNEMTLDCYSFNKYFMYKDLDCNKWNSSTPGFEIIESLLSNQGFINSNVVNNKINESNNLFNVMDVDSSQENAINAVFNNTCTVIQGPPGTGKSQTIVNLIAKALGENKKVLFVSEKKAALQVVKKRLDSVGLKDTCIEMHSQNSSKKAFLEELKRVLTQDQPIINNDKINNIQSLLNKDESYLNLYYTQINKRILNSNFTIRQLYGQIIASKALFEKNNLEIPSVQLPLDIIYLTEEENNQIIIELKKIENQISKIGNPNNHIFYGVNSYYIELNQYRDIRYKIKQQLFYLNKIKNNINKIKTSLNLYDIDDNKRIIQICDLFLQDIKTDNCVFAYNDYEKLTEFSMLIDCCDVQSIKNNYGFKDNLNKVIWFLNFIQEKSIKYKEVKDKYSNILKDDSWSHDVKTIKYIINDNIGCKFKLLKKEYRIAKKQCKDLFRLPLSYKDSKYIEILASIIECNKINKYFNIIDLFFKTLFGKLWDRENSNFDLIKSNICYLNNMYTLLNEDEVSTLLKLIQDQKYEIQKDIINNLLSDINNNHLLSQSNLSEIINLLKYDKSEKIENLTLDHQIDLFNKWYKNFDLLSQIVELNSVKQNLTHFGLNQFLKFIDNWDYSGSMLINLFKLVWYENLVEYAHNENKELKDINCEKLDDVLNEYKELDKKMIVLNREKLVKQHDDNLPLNSPNIGAISILRHEINKKGRYLSIRKIMKLAGPVVQKIKPVMMMSPLSISSYLDRNITFDLIIFDEASQIKPIDAFSAILRGKQVVVVGDDKQLPPSNFFESLENNQDENINDFEIKDFESILDLFIAKGSQIKTLQLHYRSKDPSLIKVSNNEFYNNSLIMVPSSNLKDENKGIKFHYNPLNYYDRGNSRINKAEALDIAKEAINFAKNYPKLSLGIVAFSSTQANAIQDALDKLLLDDNTYESFFHKKGINEFFIKSLENTQGDERDVIFISVGYGKTVDNLFSNNFGPINKKGGERRLNVLFTRAKYRVELFSSISDRDLYITQETSLGVKILKKYLEFARIGQYENHSLDTNYNDNVLETIIKNEIFKLGYMCDLSVGDCGIILDIAVRHPIVSNKYILAIQCDSGSIKPVCNTRDRERLRDELLIINGWCIYRLWSSAWYKDKDRELEKLKNAIESSINGSKGCNNYPPYLFKLKREHREVDIQNAFDSYTITTKENIKLFSYYHEIIDSIISLEAPIHHELLISRFMMIINEPRLTLTIKKQIIAGINKDILDRKFFFDDSFYYLTNTKQIPVRKRNSEDYSYNSKFISNEEFCSGLFKILEIGYCISLNDMPSILFKEFGFKRISYDMRKRVNDLLIYLIENKKIKIIDKYIYDSRSDKIAQ